MILCRFKRVHLKLTRELAKRKGFRGSRLQPGAAGLSGRWRTKWNKTVASGSPPSTSAQALNEKRRARVLTISLDLSLPPL